jgi:hypothetical protein
MQAARVSPQARWASLRRKPSGQLQLSPCSVAVLCGPANGPDGAASPQKKNHELRRHLAERGSEIGGEGRRAAAIVARAAPPMASSSVCAPPPMVASESLIPQPHPQDPQAISRGSGDVMRQRLALPVPRYVDFAFAAGHASVVPLRY